MLKEDMNFQQLEWYGQAAFKALALYGLAEEYELVLHHRSENVTYLVVHQRTKRKYAAMRVSRPGYHTLEETRAEMRWLERIVKEKTVTIAAPLPALLGQTVVCVDAGGKQFHCVLCEYLKGQAPDPESGDRGYWWFQKIGEAAAKLHLQTIGWKESRSLGRPVWDYEALLGEKGLFGNWRVCRALGDDGHLLLERACGQIEKRLKVYGRDLARFGLIHTDLRAANLLVEGCQLKVLDFDDCGFGWYLFDLAGSFSFIENHVETAGRIKAWLKGYTAVRALYKEDYDMIPTFLMARRIQLLAWITSHSDSDPAGIYREGFAAGTVSMAKEYLA